MLQPYRSIRRHTTVLSEGNMASVVTLKPANGGQGKTGQ